MRVMLWNGRKSGILATSNQSAYIVCLLAAVRGILIGVSLQRLVGIKFKFSLSKILVGLAVLCIVAPLIYRKSQYLVSSLTSLCALYGGSSFVKMFFTSPNK